VKLNAIPYKGVAPAITDLMGGQVPLMFCPTASVVGLARQGRLRALAVTGTRRSPLFPDLPTIAEAGLPGYTAELHYGLVAPGGTPAAIVARLNRALDATLADPGVSEKLAADGEIVMPGTPEAYAADIANEEAKWSAIIKKAALRLQ
jgi:tripartite-type tricarboxylate transporter receptor subunit TctC